MIHCYMMKRVYLVQCNALSWWSIKTLEYDGFISRWPHAFFTLTARLSVSCKRNKRSTVMLVWWVKACGQGRVLCMTACAENGGWYISGDSFLVDRGTCGLVMTISTISLRPPCFLFGRLSRTMMGGFSLVSCCSWEGMESTQLKVKERLLSGGTQKRSHYRQASPDHDETAICGWGFKREYVVMCYLDDRDGMLFSPPCQSLQHLPFVGILRARVCGRGRIA